MNIQRAQGAGRRLLELTLLVTATAILLRPEVAPATANAGPRVQLAPLTLDLADEHYVQLSLDLEGATGLTPAEIDRTQALDVAIAELAPRTGADLDTAEERADAKADLTSAILAAYDGRIAEVHVAEFLAH
ncbi:flagellar basal body-associated FliL family protein [Sporichthya polymorpha]|uniref:flagellar basal body-associated FliL family protein n=1 Tax=Sporichthya polymorpha TaxID=35751 RepID=UPI00035EA32C|nr:flagellar basal body-associated FliL family protein [Sporichthya polymorpha]